MRLGASAEVDLDLAVASLSTVADGVRLIELVRPTGGVLPEWAPGSHVDLHLGGFVRQYSLCGDPSDAERWHVAVLHEPEGRGGSRFVHDELSVGDRIMVRGPRNHFTLDAAPRYRFIAGGIGIAPLLPMIAEADAASIEWTLDYGGRERTSMAFADELRDSYGERVRLHPREEGRMRDRLERILADPAAGELVYCCGPAPMLTAMESACAAWPEGALHVEHFVPREELVTDVDAEFDVELAQSGMTLTVPADQPIINVLRDAGIDVPSSCEAGTCGTCETEVGGGEVDHRDSLLTPAEQDANDVMFICVSRAAPGCTRLILDR